MAGQGVSVLEKKNVAILGSTGSVGTKALLVLDALGEQYRAVALSAHSNVGLLAEQAKKYHPKFVAITNPDCYSELRDLIGDLDVEIYRVPCRLREPGNCTEELCDIPDGLVPGGTAGYPDRFTPRR